MFEIGERPRRQWAQTVQLRLLLVDLGDWN
jgi:hypothetical protein